MVEDIFGVSNFIGVFIMILVVVGCVFILWECKVDYLKGIELDDDLFKIIFFFNMVSFVIVFILVVFYVFLGQEDRMVKFVKYELF